MNNYFKTVTENLIWESASQEEMIFDSNNKERYKEYTGTVCHPRSVAHNCM